MQLYKRKFSDITKTSSSKKVEDSSLKRNLKVILGSAASPAILAEAFAAVLLTRQQNLSFHFRNPWLSRLLIV